MGFWFWMFWIYVAVDTLARFAKRKKYRLAEEVHEQLLKAIADLEKTLDVRIEAWRILNNLEPDQAEKAWNAIKGQVVGAWWPKRKKSEEKPS